MKFGIYLVFVFVVWSLSAHSQDSAPWDFGDNFNYTPFSDSDRAAWGFSSWVKGSLVHTGELKSDNNLLLLQVPEDKSARDIIVEMRKQILKGEKASITIKPLKKLSGVRTLEFIRTEQGMSMTVGFFYFTLGNDHLIVAIELESKTYSKYRTMFYAWINSINKG